MPRHGPGDVDAVISAAGQSYRCAAVGLDLVVSALPLRQSSRSPPAPPRSLAVAHPFADQAVIFGTGNADTSLTEVVVDPILGNDGSTAPAVVSIGRFAVGS